MNNQPCYRARRWAVARTHSWLNRFHKLLVSFDKTGLRGTAGTGCGYDLLAAICSSLRTSSKSHSKHHTLVGSVSIRLN